MIRSAVGFETGRMDKFVERLGYFFTVTVIGYYVFIASLEKSCGRKLGARLSDFGHLKSCILLHGLAPPNSDIWKRIV